MANQPEQLPLHAEPAYAPRPSSGWKRFGWACMFWLPALLGLIGWTCAALVPRHPFAMAVVLGAVAPLGFITCGVVAVILHELAHYVVARCARLKLFCFSIGHGPLLWQWQAARGTIFAIRAIPFSGYITFSMLDQPRLRAKVFLVAAAGPFANILLAVGGWKLLVGQPYWWTEFGLTDWIQFFLPIFCLFNAALALFTLVPFEEDFAGAKNPSDGLRILQVLFRSDRCDWNMTWTKLSELLGANRTSTASSGSAPEVTESVWFKTVNVQDPNWFLPSYREMLEQPDMPAHIRPEILDSFATAVLMFDAREYLADADRYSRELIQLQPNERTVQGTRGSVLIELGQVDEGMAMLRPVVEDHPKPSDQAIAAAYLALGEFKKGNLEEAAEWIQKARAFDPNCVPMRRIASSIGAAALSAGRT